jgi:gliding motility-associated-like protein
MSIKKLLLYIILCLPSMAAFSQLQITPQTSAQQLAQYLVGEGIIISNMTVNGSPFATGFFKNISGTNISLDSGIVLSTGRVQTSGTITGLNGPAVSHASTVLNFPGDAQLNSLVSNGVTGDATILEFDFIPQGDSVSFRYVFSSEEYPQFTCTNFNDVFAFFISGPGIPIPKNIALVPNTNIPVAINSINSGTPGGGGSITTCNNMGVGSPFTQYYIDNIGNLQFTHNGHTTVLTAKSAVQPCQVYHLKIAIADVLDQSYDSNVFLEARSLKSPPLQLVSANPVTNGMPYLVEGCHTGAFKVIRSRKFPYGQPVTLYYSGTAVNGVDVELLPLTGTIPAGDSVLTIPVIPIIDNLPEGTEVLKIYVSNGCVGNSNFFLDSLEIQLRDVDILNLVPNDTVICRNSPVQFIATGTYNSFQWTPATGLSNPNISNPVLTPIVSQTYVCTATLNNCTAIDSVVVKVKSIALISSEDVLCKGATTGQIKVSGQGQWNTPTLYSINNGPYGSNSTFNNLGAGSYIVRVSDNSGCTDSVNVNILQSFPDLLLSDSLITASCVGQNGQIHLTGSGGLQPYNFTIDNGSYGPSGSFNAVTGGNHIIKIKDQNGCITTRPVVINNDPPINLNITVDPASCNGSPTGKIYLTASGGSGIFQYTIDGNNFQSADSFIVSVPNVTGTVKDNKGCTASQTVTVPLNILVSVFIGNDTTICEGTTHQFNTQGNAQNYTWQANPTLSATNIKNPVASPVTTTTYYVTATQDICIVKDTITISINPAPVANAGIDTSICAGKTINLEGSGGVAYSWTPASAVINPTAQNPSIKPQQTMNFYLEVTDANGCKSLKKDTVLVDVVPAVQAFAGKDTLVGIGQPVQLIGLDLGNSGVTSYVWSPPTGLDDPNIPNPVATISQDIIYTLTLTTPEGCEGTDQILIRAFEGPEIYVPSGFTPNGDGKNDILRAFPVGMKEFRYFRVFNRWGEMIFSTPNYNRGWDGTIRGAKQATGSFIWTAEAVDYRGNVISRKGVVTLIR